eukprot:scaffold38760_cov58-Cyclotella_meneghiniana.AAC.4
MWLRGHLQMLSVVDCGVYDSESKIDEVLLWKVFYDLHELLATGALWLSVHPGQWSPKGSRFAGWRCANVDKMRHTIDDGSTTGANSSLIHTPSVANRIQLLFVTMAAGIADRINGSKSCRATSALQSST